MVSLEISDTGAGIPPEHLDRVLEPFYTTKEEPQPRRELRPGGLQQFEKETSRRAVTTETIS